MIYWIILMALVVIVPVALAYRSERNYWKNSFPNFEECEYYGVDYGVGTYDVMCVHPYDKTKCGLGDNKHLAYKDMIKKYFAY